MPWLLEHRDLDVEPLASALGLPSALSGTSRRLACEIELSDLATVVVTAVEKVKIAQLLAREAVAVSP